MLAFGIGSSSKRVEQNYIGDLFTDLGACTHYDEDEITVDDGRSGLELVLR